MLCALCLILRRPNGRLIINSVIVSLALNWQAERRAFGQKGKGTFSTGPSKYRFVFTFAAASFCRNYQMACPSSPNSSDKWPHRRNFGPLPNKPGQTICKALGIETYLHSCLSLDWHENSTRTFCWQCLTVIKMPNAARN